MKRKNIILSAIFLLSVSFLVFGKTFDASAAENSDTICKGVFIDEVDVSGMTRDEAQAAVDKFVESLRSKRLGVNINKKTVNTTMGELGYTYQVNDNINQALSLGKAGNLIKRYKDIKDIENGSKVYPLTFTLDDKSVKNFIANKVSEFNLAPLNASVARKNGRFVYTKEVPGNKVNADKTAAQISEKVLNNWNRSDITVDAVMEEDLPKYTRESFDKCNKILGSYSTTYADSSADRAANLANGSRLINNTVVYPGEVFSSYEHLSPFTAEHGYHVAGAYLQGKVIDSVGGGSCQVTTTLYNAILNAELEVVQRQPHSMVISYVEVSRDAAIAGTYKDFKFKNNSKTPILIESYTQGRRITFNIWGNETRDTKHRTVKYKSVTISRTNPPADVITKDPNLPTSYWKVTQSAHTGYRAELYKIVYIDNVEVSRTLVNKSVYNAAPRYITIGTKKEKTVKEKTAEEKKKKPTQAPKEEMPPEEKQTDTEEKDQDSIETETQPQSTSLPDTVIDPLE